MPPPPGPARADLRIESTGVAVDRPLPAVVALLAALIVVLSMGAFMFSSARASGGVIWAFAVSLGVALVSATAMIQQRIDPARYLRADARGAGEIEITGDAVIATARGRSYRYKRADITGGWMERAGERASVVLVTTSRHVISVDVPSIDVAEALLSAAGVAADQQALRTRIAPWLSRGAIMGVVALPVSLLITLGAICSTAILVLRLEEATRNPAILGEPVFLGVAGVFAAFALGFAAVVAGLVPPKLVIGNDGLTIHGIFRRRFITYARVQGVRRGTDAVDLDLDDDSVVHLPVEARFTDATSYVNPVLESIHGRIVEGLARRGGAGTKGALGALDRAGRTLGEWRDHLRALGGAKGSYRHIALTTEDIAAVVSDTEAPRELRIAAALALSGADDDAVKARVRDAARASADEALRVALEAAAEDELTEEVLRASMR